MKAFFSIFFTGMSMPMSAALVSHIVGYNMTWSTTVKTVEKSNFFLQIPLIFKRFYPQLVFFTLMVVSRIYSIKLCLMLGIDDCLFHLGRAGWLQDCFDRGRGAARGGGGVASAVAIRIESLVLVVLGEWIHWVLNFS